MVTAKRKRPKRPTPNSVPTSSSLGVPTVQPSVTINGMDGAFIKAEIPPPRMPMSQADRQTIAAQMWAQARVDVLHDFPAIFDLEIMHGIVYPHESLIEAYESGCAEPWTTQVVTSLLIASNQRNVLETGSFTGQTSAWLAMALQRLGGGTLTTVDIDPERVQKTAERLNGLPLDRVQCRCVESDVLLYLPMLEPKSVGFAWIDDLHEAFHVEREVNLLWDKMVPGGIMLFHDVHGHHQLKNVVNKYGGYSIDLPRLGASGGLGILQIPK